MKTTKKRINHSDRQPCPICHSDGEQQCRWTPPYNLFHCPRCDSLFCHPMPSNDEQDKFYQGFLFKKPDENELRLSVSKKLTELNALFPDLDPKGKSFLDYGGGTGATALAASELGFDVTFYEIDKEAALFVRAISEGNSLHICSDPDELNLKKFDIILSDNVIEHVQDPAALLKDLFTRLNKNGHLVVKTPNARNTELLLHPIIPIIYLKTVSQNNSLGKFLKMAYFRPWTFDSPRHLFAFSSKALQLMSNEAGAMNIHISTYNSQEASTKTLRHKNRNFKQTHSYAIAFILEILASFCMKLIQPFHTITPAGLMIHIRNN